MKSAKSKRTPKGVRLLDFHRPCVLSAICGCHQQTLGVKVDKPLVKTKEPMQLFGVQDKKVVFGAQPRQLFAHFWR